MKNITTICMTLKLFNMSERHERLLFPVNNDDFPLNVTHSKTMQLEAWKVNPPLQHAVLSILVNNIQHEHISHFSHDGSVVRNKENSRLRVRDHWNEMEIQSTILTISWHTFWNYNRLHQQCTPFLTVIEVYEKKSLCSGLFKVIKVMWGCILE